MSATEAAPRKRRTLLIAIGVAVIFLAVVIIGQLALNGKSSSEGEGSPPSDTSVPSSEEESPLVKRDPGDPMAFGATDAPVVLVEWTDLRCPFCAAFHRDTLPVIVEEYVDAGLIRIEVHDVAYFGEQSEDAAVAARAAAEQGMFFEYLDAVYDAAPGSGHADLTRDALIAFAKQAGVPDLARFTADLDDPDIRLAAQESTSFAQQIGVSAVPFFVANEMAMSGAQPIEVFRDYLDDAIARAG